MAQQFFTQPPFDARLTRNMAFPLTGDQGGGTALQMGYMIWDKPMPGYGQRAIISYLYNPSTVAADFAMSDASAQAALNYPNAGDTAMLAIPISQTAQWSLMFDRTFDLWGTFNANGQPDGRFSTLDSSTLGVQADVMAFMQFTGMFYNSGITPSQAAAQNTNLATNAGIMMQWPSWAIFGNTTVGNALRYYGYISEFSVQYTHWTQFNVPMRCVISVTFTMLSMPGTQPPALPASNITSLLNGSANQPVTPALGASGIGGT